MFRAWLGQIMRTVRGDPSNGAPGRPLPISPFNPDDSANPAPGLEPAASDPSPSQHLRQAEEQHAIQTAQDELPEDERQVLRLVYFEALSYAEVAERLQLTYDQVRYRHELGLRGLEIKLRARREFQA